ncbi:MAG: NAD(P)H-dependent oxidoreductase subunit E [Vicinamibacteria bacterium]|nr:NAD(P)H-dependent oxidoreductase subunit E [Vicinamibacteria bacterium]
MIQLAGTALVGILEEALDRHGKSPQAALQVLMSVQRALHHVPDEAVEYLSSRLSLPPVRLRGLVSFYSFLSRTPQGEYVVHLSDNITDQMRGSRKLGDALCERLGVRLGETRSDLRTSVHRTSCIGMADQGPAALVNYRPVTRLDDQRVGLIADLINARVRLEEWPPEFFRVESNIRRSDVIFRKPIEPGAALRASLDRGGKNLEAWEEDLAPTDARRHQLERGGAETLKEIYRAELRGRGGAGFHAGIKWQSVREAARDDRYVLCNADEGEPGAFKDRVLLTDFADMVFEGMTVCGHVVGARKGIVYVRQEYAYLHDHLQGVLERRRARGLLGTNILGSPLDFDIELHFGAGAYICGMETAMIKSIEGRRGIPRRRWPLPVHQGYLKAPTVVNNVETFACAAAISARGGAWFAGIGTPQSTGTRLFCLSGDCERPGTYEYPMGVTIREILRDCGALDAQGIQVGGPSGALINRGDFDRAVCFEDLPGVGAMMVFGPKRDLFDAITNFALFFQHESCGLCTPCRVGTTLLANYVKKFERGVGSPVDIAEVKHISSLMKNMAHCGLGQSASNHLMDSLQKFPHIWESRMKTQEFVPAFDLDWALEEARSLTGRTDPAAHLPARP